MTTPPPEEIRTAKELVMVVDRNNIKGATAAIATALAAAREAEERRIMSEFAKWLPSNPPSR